jgi:peptide/nickel transport system permease protein
MSAYILRRLLYTIPVWLGVILITFILFNLVRDPQSIAEMALGKSSSPESRLDWIHNKGYGYPTFWPTDAWRTENAALIKKYPNVYENATVFDSQFFKTMTRFLAFDLGRSDKTGRPIGDMIRERVGPTMKITVPAFLLGLFINISVSLFVVMYRGTKLDHGMVFATVLLMSVPILLYLIGISYLNGIYLKLFPIYGTIFLPVVISIISGLGGAVRFYRTVFLDQVGEDYTRTARAKGLSEWAVMYKHVLPNSLIPILTSAVMQIPFLITGSLLLETFFGIPGLGDMFITAINSSDFSTIKAFVYLGSILYMIGTVMTDISYTLVDPRVTLE